MIVSMDFISVLVYYLYCNSSAQSTKLGLYDVVCYLRRCVMRFGRCDLRLGESFVDVRLWMVSGER